MKTFLNSYIEKHKSATLEEITQFEKRFEDTIDKVHFVFDEQAFRRVVDPAGNKDALLNRALMDVIMVSFDRFYLDDIKRKKDDILKLYASLPFKDTRFADSISYRTSDNIELEYRLCTWLREINNLMS